MFNHQGKARNENSDEGYFYELKTFLRAATGYCHEIHSNIICRCPYCGDSRKHKNKGHLYIDKFRPIFHCVRCNESGRLGKLLLDLQANLSEYNLSKYLTSSQTATQQHPFRSSSNKTALLSHIPQLKPPKINSSIFELAQRINNEVYHLSQSQITYLLQQRQVPILMTNLQEEFDPIQDALCKHSTQYSYFILKPGTFLIKLLETYKQFYTTTSSQVSTWINKLLGPYHEQWKDVLDTVSIGWLSFHGNKVNIKILPESYYNKQELLNKYGHIRDIAYFINRCQKIRFITIWPYSKRIADKKIDRYLSFLSSSSKSISDPTIRTIRDHISKYLLLSSGLYEWDLFELATYPTNFPSENIVVAAEGLFDIISLIKHYRLLQILGYIDKKQSFIFIAAGKSYTRAFNWLQLYLGTTYFKEYHIYLDADMGVPYKNKKHKQKAIGTTPVFLHKAIDIKHFKDIDDIVKYYWPGYNITSLTSSYQEQVNSKLKTFII